MKGLKLGLQLGCWGSNHQPTPRSWSLKQNASVSIQFGPKMSVATRKSALMAMRSPHLWPREVRSCGHQMSSPLAEAST